MTKTKEVSQGLNRLPQVVLQAVARLWCQEGFQVAGVVEGEGNGLVANGMDLKDIGTWVSFCHDGNPEVKVSLNFNGWDAEAAENPDPSIGIDYTREGVPGVDLAAGALLSEGFRVMGPVEKDLGENQLVFRKGKLTDKQVPCGIRASITWPIEFGPVLHGDDLQQYLNRRNA